MKKFPMLVFAFGVPLLGFLVLKDGSGTIYKSSSSGAQGYQIELPEDEVAVSEPVEEEIVVEEIIDEDGAVEEVVVEEIVIEEDVATAEAQAADEEAATEEVAPKETASDAEPATDTAEVVAALSEEEMNAGQRAARACTSCHQLDRERNTVGPHLVGVIGRTIGSVDGFRYSEALLALGEEGQVWTQENIAEWLADPSAFAEGTKMKFKINDADDRRLIAGYLAGR